MLERLLHDKKMQQVQKPGSQALRIGRFSQRHGVYLATTVTWQRIPWFQDHDLACIMCRSLGNARISSDATLLCWVVMPDHLHLLLQLDASPLAAVINRLKSYSARTLNRAIGRSGRFWDHGFHDHALRREEAMVDVARYIVANPVRAGLVRRCGDYPYWDAVWV